MDKSKMKHLSQFANCNAPTSWIHFTNVGDWASDHRERPSITEFLQSPHGIKTAYDMFKDARHVSPGVCRT